MEKMKENLVEVLEIWMPTKGGDGSVFDIKRQQFLKMAALIVNGNPIKLEDGFLMERKHITKEEAEAKDLV